MTREFDLANDIGDHLEDIKDIARALLLAGLGMQVDRDGAAVIKLASIISDRAKAAEEMRGELFHLLHPDPKHRQPPAKAAERDVEAIS